MNGRLVPVKWEMARLMKIASSITAMRMNGRLIDFSTRAMMMKMAMMEMAFTTLKSVSVVSIMSFMAGASPMSSEPSVCFLAISFNLATWSLASSEAVPYSEPISTSSHLSVFNFSVISVGRNSIGMRSPTSDSRLSTYFTPSTFFISPTVARTFSSGVSDFTRSMWVAPIWKLSSSFFEAIL